MAKVVIHLAEKGLDEMIKALDQVGVPSFMLTTALEGVLADAFAMTQANVHVISGRLKASGRTESDFQDNVWSGSILYGGPKGTPAYYAIYEKARPGVKAGVGTPHDFFAGLETLDARFEDALNDHFTAVMA